jgi:hypothetical protein
VDDDGDLDIYVLRRRTGPAHPGGGDVGRDLLLLGDGTNAQFRIIGIPPPEDSRAKADDVLPIDRNQDGRSEFLVLNGGSEEPAPIQLLAYG